MRSAAICLVIAGCLALPALCAEPEAKGEPAEPVKVEPKAVEPKAEPKEAPKAEPKAVEPKAEPEPAPKALPAPPFVGEVTGQRVYIRAGDSINHTVLSVAARGDKVEVKERRYEWYRIPVPKTCTVWVRNDMVAIEAEGKAATLVKDRVNVRSRPGLASDVLGQLPRGLKVSVVDGDGDWVGIAPPPQATAWIHSQHVRKVGEAGPDVAVKEEPRPVLARGAAAEALRKAQELYQAELAKPADKRDFDEVLAAYQKVAAQSDDPASAAAAERARQRLLKIVDLHNALRAAAQPVDEFEKKYKALEEEYKKRAEEAGKPKPE